MKVSIPYDISDLFFRLLFSLIFIGLGFEHIFSDELIQGIMPDWLGFKRPLSVLAGTILLVGGFAIMAGYKTREGALLLGVFLIVVTLLIHAPAIFQPPAGMPEEWCWVWDVYQRSNLAKNLCLLGGCIHLLNHKTGRYSLQAWFARKETANATM